MKKKGSLSWVVVVLGIIIFFPVGLYLLYKKLREDKMAVLQRGIRLRMVGWTLISVGGVGLIWALITGQSITLERMISSSLFYFGGGGAILLVARYLGTLRKKYEQYMDLVMNQHQTSVDKIASQMNFTYEQAAKDLQKMINVGCFENAYISTANREIVLPYRKQTEKVFSTVSSGYQDDQKPQKQISIMCKNCGGNNVFAAGMVHECDFCGSPISVEE